MSLLTRFQREFQSLYHLELDPTLRIDDYLFEQEGPQEVTERLLLREREGDLEVALYLNRGVLQTLERQKPWRRLDSSNLEAFCTVIEGVSHFLTVVRRAADRHPISQLELELQAEVDKFIFCLFYLKSQGSRVSPSELRAALFGAYHLVPGLSQEETDRYELANRLAFRYCKSLEGLTRRGQGLKLLKEVRRFRQRRLEEKIRQAA